MIWHVNTGCTVLFLIVFKLETSGAQFPKHLDLQKVGEVQFNGEKYNLLKPSAHTITDYFKHFMLGEIRRVPNEKVFIDDNGFRHDWSYFDEKSRKHYIVQDTKTLKEIKVNIKDQTVDKKGEKTSKNEIKIRKKPRRKKKIIEEEVEKESLNENNKTDLRDGGRTVARTTFFCPFFGVITMASYLD